MVLVESKSQAAPAPGKVKVDEEAADVISSAPAKSQNKKLIDQ